MAPWIEKVFVSLNTEFLMLSEMILAIKFQSVSELFLIFHEAVKVY